MEGFHNKVLYIDVSRRSFAEEHINDEIYRDLLGGKGLGMHLLFYNARLGVEPRLKEVITDHYVACHRY